MIRRLNNAEECPNQNFVHMIVAPLAFSFRIFGHKQIFRILLSSNNTGREFSTLELHQLKMHQQGVVLKWRLDFHFFLIKYSINFADAVCWAVTFVVAAFRRVGFFYTFGNIFTLWRGR